MSRAIGGLFRTAAIVLSVFAGLALLLYYVVVAVNWRDREPSPAAVRLAHAYLSRPAVADADNAYVYAMGFPVASTEDPEQMGLRRIAWLKRMEDRATTQHLIDMEYADDPLSSTAHDRDRRDARIVQLNRACSHGGSECAEAFDNSDETYEVWLGSEAWLLARYQALIARHGWREIVPTNTETPFPPFSQIMDGQRLLLLEARHLVGQGDYAGAKALLNADARFWRGVLESGDTLFTKIIATSALNRHFDLGNLILRRLHPQAVTQVMPDIWRVPISEAERSMYRCMTGEWIFASGLSRALETQFRYKLIDGTNGGKRFGRTVVAVLGAPLYQPQDSINRYADYYLRLADVFDTPLAQYEKVMPAAAKLEKQARDASLFSLYNIIGSWVVRNGISDFSDYARRVADIEGVRRASLAAVALRELEIQDGDFNRALETIDARNPYTDRPFEWSKEHRAVRFRGLQNGERAEHLLYY